MSSSSKTVKFRRESPSGGSYLDHQRSDSGVGSFSDSDSRGPYGDRYAGSDYDSLHDRLDAEIYAKKEWMKKASEFEKKATEFESKLVRAYKEAKEAEARLRALNEHNQQLTEAKTQLEKANKELAEDNIRLRDDLTKDNAKDKDKRASRRKSESPPLMSGANPATVEKPKRSASKHRSSREASGRADREKEKERDAQRPSQREDSREMDRLRQRFNAREGGEIRFAATVGEESDATGKSSISTKSHRSRRDSYVEPLGQPAPRPQVLSHGPPPPSPSVRQYNYGSGPYPPQPQYPQPGTTPRAAHPQVVVSYSDASYDEEDGLYHAHPLPKQPRSQDRRR